MLKEDNLLLLEIAVQRLFFFVLAGNKMMTVPETKYAAIRKKVDINDVNAYSPCLLVENSNFGFS